MKKLFKQYEFCLFLIIIALSVFFTFSAKNFFTMENLLDLLLSYSFLGIMSAGMLVVLISGGIDLSFTAIATIAQYTLAIVIINYNGNIVMGFLVACTIGITLGICNALLIHYFKAPALIITIATLNIFFGTIIYITRGTWIYNFPLWFKDFQDVFRFTTSNGVYCGIPLPVVLLIIVFVITYFILKYTVLGRKIYTLGGNREASRRMGFNLLTITLFVYGYMGFLAGLGGIAHLLIVKIVQSNAIVGRELEVIAAVVLGGASITGGTGTVLGTIMGVTLIAIMWNGLVLMGVSSYWHKVILGLIIIISVCINAYNRKKSAQGGDSINVE